MRSHLLLMERVRAQTAALPPGGGRFVLPRLTLGLFRSDQPTHRFALGGDRRRLIPLRAGQGWIMPAGAEGVCEYDDGLTVTTVELDAAALEGTGLDPRDGALLRVGAFDPLLASLATAAEGFGSGSRLYRDSMELALAQHLAQVLRPLPPAQARIDDRRLRRALSLIDERLSEDLSVADLAAAAAMSEAHFSRAFKAATGRSPLRYVIDARMERARALLRGTSRSVAEVAWAVGYADVSRFGEHFRRAAGTTPAAFRAA
jgi:AraC family transcriptional regulator